MKRKSNLMLDLKFSFVFYKTFFHSVFFQKKIIFSSLFYLLLTNILINVVPILSSLKPAYIIVNPINGVFMVLGASIISIVYVIEIFKTPIDNGTELLILSKPISRTQIIWTKLLIFVSMVFMIAILSSLCTLFLFFNPISTVYENMTIFFGLMVLTIISMFLFGAISIISSMFFSKIRTFLIPLFVSLLITIFTILNSFIFSNPVQVMRKMQYDLSTKNYLYKNKNKLSSNYGATLRGDLDSQENHNQLWNFFEQESTYKNIVYVDIGTQLSTMIYLSNSNFINGDKVLENFNFFNSPFKIKYRNWDVQKDSSKLEILFNTGLFSEKTNQFLLSINKDSIINYDSFYTINDFYKYLLFDYVPNDNSNDKKHTFDIYWEKYGSEIVSIIKEEHSNNLNSLTSNGVDNMKNGGSYLIEKIFNEYFEKKNLTFFNFVNFQQDVLFELTASVIEDFFKTNNSNIPNVNLFNLLDYEDIRDDVYLNDVFNNIDKYLVENPNFKNELSKFFDVIPSGDTKLNKIHESLKEPYKSYIESKVKENKENDYKIKLRTKLNILGFNIPQIITKNNLNLLNYNNGYLFDTTKNIGFKISHSKNNQIENILINPIIVMNFNSHYDNFYKIYSNLYYNGESLIASWLSISIILLLISISFYSKRDII